ncbi:MAG: hypothetical protein ACYTG6_04445 [Planctomycetota bacterium]|jgi:hypothetical protein
MTTGTQIKMGTKIEADEAETLDRNKMGVGTPRPPSGDVEGQEGMEYVICPWYGAVNYVYVSDVRWIWYTCWSCGNPFKV